MNNFDRNQLTILLAFYYFDYPRCDQKGIKKFVDRFNDHFNLDTSVQNITYFMGLIKSIDPSHNAGALSNSDEEIASLWKYYIVDDRLQDLRERYTSFKKEKIERILVETDETCNDQLGEIIIRNQFSFSGDKPKQLYEANDSKVSKTTKRDLIVSYNALKLANFKCEYDLNHELFIRKNTNVNYTEGHHLVPLEYQYMFNVNLDVEANIVSLCSNCHNNLHYGKNYEVILRKLFDERKDRLEACGIVVSFDQLLDMYK